MYRFSGWELLIVLAVILLLFGPGRIGKIAGELGQGIKNFREGLKNKDEDGKEEETTAKEPPEEKK
jgi:sec-independent protein translocase protein TatA